MKTISKTLLAAAVSSMSLGAMAEISIDFESNAGYKSLGVYDVWEQSPFRTGELTGNWAVTANPNTEINEIIGEAPNPSAMVLGAQRSRFGSNRFGVRIDLEETFELTTTLKYVHVMMLRPTSGRMMLVGLGSRPERKDQNPYCEQFWAVSSNSAEPGVWTDVVFPIKGNGGIDIRSLVVVPDMESPHNLTEDFLFYIDNLKINTSSVPEIIYEYYPVVGSKATTPMTRTDRVTSDLSLTIDGKTFTAPIAQQTNKLLYQDLTNHTFYVKPGQTITPALGYTTKDWMHAYAYIDYNNDGKFEATLKADGTPAEGSEIVSYNGYNGATGSFINSTGAAIASNGNLGAPNCGKMPAFTIPANLEPGMYRMRLKLDWNSIDPMGNPGDAEGKNTINGNGGVIADVMLNVYGPNVTVNDFQLNGEVLAADGSKLNAYQAPADQAFTFMMAPEKGFVHDGADIKIGYNLDSESKFDKYGNPQYTELSIPGYLFSDDALYTLPAEMMRGNMLINGRMVEVGQPVSSAYPLNFPTDLAITRTDRKLNSVTIANEGHENSVINITSNLVYQDKLDVEVPVYAGKAITPSVNYTGNAMHTYWYVDLDENGQFSFDVTDSGTPAGEMLSYSYLDGKNSLGQSLQPGIKPEVNHPFTLPQTTAPGLYRCRFKIDWNYADPGAKYGQGNNDINDNGGYVMDFLLHVHGQTVPVTAETSGEHGNLRTAEGSTIDATGINAPHAAALTIDGTTTSGSTVSKLTVRYGYNLESPATRFGHTYWRETELRPNADGTITIPAEILDRPVHLTGEYTQSAISEINADKQQADTIYDLRGMRVSRPVSGIYIVNGRKTVVK